MTSPGVRAATAVSRLPDRGCPGIAALFVGINPGLRSAAVGHHFAGYSNRFWKLLFDSGLVPVPLRPEDDARLPEFGFGITNLVRRPTAGIGELSSSEYRAGRRRLAGTVRRLRPKVVVLVGVTLFRALFPRSTAGPLGPTAETLAGIPVFVVPNPSGRNANYSYTEMLEVFSRLAQHIRQLE